MIGVWVDFLRTPMAAPETAGLRTLRMAILSLAVVMAFSITTLKPLRVLFGAAAGGAVAGMLLILAVLVPVYILRKVRRDEAYLDQLAADRDDAGAAR